VIKTSPFSEWGRKLALFKEKTFCTKLGCTNEQNWNFQRPNWHECYVLMLERSSYKCHWMDQSTFQIKIGLLFWVLKQLWPKNGKASKVSLHQHVSVLNCVLESWLVMVANTRSHEFIRILQLCIGSGVYWNFNVASFYLKISISLNKTWLLWSRWKVGREVIP
jgi:hypothetical protein